MPSLSISEFRSEISELYTPPARRPKTRTKVLQVLDEFAAVGVERTDQFTPPMISRWLAAHRDRHGVTAKSLLRSLGALCSYAESMEYLAKNPLRVFKHRIRAVPKRVNVYHPARDIARLLSMLEGESVESWKSHRLYALVATVAYTGIRKMEALTLQTVDIDIAERVIYVVDRDPEDPLKTEGSAAPVAMPDELAPILADWMRLSVERWDSPSPWLIPHCFLDGPWTEGATKNKPLNQVAEAGLRAGIKGLTINSLRHTWGTMAESMWDLSNGVIQRQLRHTTERTQKVYKHADLDNLREKCRLISFRRTPTKEGDDDGEKARNSA